LSQPFDQLRNLGFSQYEAQAYITLLQHPPLNGYELAKYSGIPRANIYPVIQKLEERGAVLRMESENAPRYAPVPVEQLISRLGRLYQETLDAASRSLGELQVCREDEYIWNVRGYSVFIDLARSLAGRAQEKLLVAVHPPESAALAEEMKRAEARGVEITTLCLAECRQECGGCRGKVHRTPAPPTQEDRWLVLAQDEKELLAGEIQPEEETVAISTRQRLLVNLGSWYIRQSIALAALIQGPGGMPQEGLAPETRLLLEGLDMVDARPTWSQQWQRFLKRD
jgi:predicted transcriptional regulator